MLWYLPWSENIKKRACRYLLQRYLGNFLEEKLTLDQLSVDLYNGTGTVLDVSLDCEALNELGDSQNWPIEIVDGYMKEITVTIPWSTILKDDSVVEVNGLCLTVQPKVRAEPASSMLESMWSSMSSSMQLAAECLKQDDGPPETNPVEGIEMFAHAIDSILSRVKVRFVNSKIRIEHVPKNSDRGIALEIHIKNIEYFDEAGSEPPPDVTDPDSSNTYIVSTYTNKKFFFDGITLYSDEFPSKLRTMARSLVMEKSASTQPEKSEGSQLDMSDINFQSATSDVFYETKSLISNAEAETNELLESGTNENVIRREVTPEERANQPDPILFAKVIGRQELGMKIKHSPEAAGPKVEVQVTLGSLVVFLTPRQLHTIIELVDGLNQPHLEDTSNIPMRPSGMNMQCKPMGQADFQRIESQLLGNFHRETKPNFATYGWTGQSFDDSDAEEKFQPMTAGNQASDSFCSSVSSMNTSGTSSVNLPTMQPRIKRNRKVPQIDGDPTAEVSHVNIRMSSCSCLLLHKDILIPVPLGTDCVSPSSARKMQEAASEFFERLGFFTISGHGKRDFDAANLTFDKATDRSHLRLISSVLSLEGSEKTTSHGSQTSCEASVSHLLLRECLYSNGQDSKPEGFDLVKFHWKEQEDSDDDSSSTTIQQPNVRVNFKQTLKYMRISGEKKLVYPTTDLTVKCQPFVVDVELTLMERMSATLFRNSNSSSTTPSGVMLTNQNQFNFTLQCANIDTILRFPIADLRAVVSCDSRRIRADYLVLKAHEVLVSSQLLPSARPLPTTLTLRATALDFYYYENENAEGTHIACSSMDESFDPNILKGATAPLPTISLTFKPSKASKGPFDPLSDEETYDPPSNPMTTSMHMMHNLRNSTQPGPFTNKKTAHQSITKHDDNSQGQVEELIVPGTAEEMAEFTTHSVDNSAVHLELSLPVLSLQLESKQLYEIIYNRINSDLLLWEPQFGEQYEISPLMAHPSFGGPEASIYPAFSICKGAGYDSDSASTSSDDDNLYYSTYDNKSKQRKLSATKQTGESKDAHNFCLTFKVSKGLLTIYAPVRDSNKRVVPGQMGELVVEAGGLVMCHVSGLRGRARTAQMGLRAAKCAFYHEALLTIPSDKPSLRMYGTVLPSYMKETIYPSGKGVIMKDEGKKDMLSLALNVEPQAELPNFKKICLALGIEHASLRHRGNAGIAWLTQLLDVLDVTDYPVPGYQPSTVLTELHVHLWDCAIDYRPLYLPIRTVLTLGNFSVSSNVIAQTNTSSLRFLAQECALYLNHLTGTKPGVPIPQDDDKQPDVKKDYVSVIEVGLFELSLRMADKATTSGPHVDLCASNNVITMATCWDSASALFRLVTYAACDGDCIPPEDSTRHTSFCSDKGLDSNPLVGLDDTQEDIRELSPSEIQQVNDLMEEAMKESPNTTQEEEEIISSTEREGVEIFFFPDESNKPKPKSAEIEIETDSTSLDYDDFRASTPELAEEAKPNAHVAKELGDPTSKTTPQTTPQKPARSKKQRTSEGSNTDDEYCIIESAPPSEDDELAEPVVKWYGSEPVPMIENHFTVPAAKSDVLKAPKSFPVPCLRYTLCEMSIVWHMYGGNDFRLPGENAPSAAGKKNVTINDGDTRQGSPTMANRGMEYEPYESSRATAAAYRSGVRWTSGSERLRAREGPAGGTVGGRRGGVNRDLKTSVIMNLHKVKFQHETYQSGGTHASRQTLAISKIEVLDRLSNSHINKFLSQFVLTDEPERKNAHMLVVKAVHLRPDPTLSAQECCLKVSLLPLRFNIDQDTMAFMVNFFSKLGTDESEDDGHGPSPSEASGPSSRQATPTRRPPVMSVTRVRDPPPTPTSLGDGDALSLADGSITNEEPLMETYEAERLVSDNLIQLEEDFQRLGVGQDKPAEKQPDAEPVDDSPVYFRRVVFAPEVPIRLDYVGKRVDLSAGPVAGLLMGLGQLNCSELKLKRLYHRHGLLGLERLLKWALHEWLSDIKRHQLPGLLSGIGPMHSLLQFITGIRDLVWLPLEQWRRDGRLVHGLRRGAASFTARTAVAALDVTARILHLIQATAETALDMLTPGPTLQLQDAYARRERRRRRRQDPARHPNDIREGVASAYNTVTEGFAETAATISQAARSSRGVGVLRHLPGAAVAPLALAAAGAADVLGGVRASLAPQLARDRADKWRQTDDSSLE